MAGKKLVPQNSRDFDDPFNVGQMIGMLVLLTFIEERKTIPADHLEKLKRVCADNASAYMEQPTEDIFLMIDNLVKEMN